MNTEEGPEAQTADPTDAQTAGKRRAKRQARKAAASAEGAQPGRKRGAGKGDAGKRAGKGTKTGKGRKGPRAAEAATGTEADPAASAAKAARRAARGGARGAKGGKSVRVAGERSEPLQTRKVFCLGFAQTGQDALSDFFAARGFQVAGTGRWALASHLAARHPSFAAQAFCAGEEANFANLDTWFPGSLFVLNTRSELEWLQARIKHVLRHAAGNWTGAPLATPPGAAYADDALMQAFFPAPTLCVDRWILTRRMYHAAVRDYFATRGNLVEIAVLDDASWTSTLGAALDAFDLTASDLPAKGKRRGGKGREAKAPEPDMAESLTFDDFPLMRDYLDLAADRVAAMGPDIRPYSHADFLAAHGGAASCQRGPESRPARRNDPARWPPSQPATRV